MPRICLIKPPQIIPRSWGIPRVFQPVGLAYVAAVLEKEYEVHILDAQAEGWQDLRTIDGKYYSGLGLQKIADRIREINPDIVGISIQFSVNERIALEIASLVKSIDKNIVVILGGPHCTARPQETLAHPAADFLVIGEGEYSTLELIHKLEAGSGWEDVRGIAFKKDGKPVLTAPRAPIEDLDALPLPAYHRLPMEEYFTAAKAEIGSRGVYVCHHRWTSMITSRGCPFQCNFCSIFISMGRRYRVRSPEHVTRELEQLVNNYGVRHICFEDDNLTLNRSRFKAICDSIIDRGFGITWSAPNSIRADTLDEEIVTKMKESGCKRVAVSPESGVQRVVTEIIGKRLDLGKVEESVALLSRHDIDVDAYFVIGLIGERKEDIWATIQYADKLRKLGLCSAGFYIATPYYGTRLRQEAEEKGYLKRDISDLLSTSDVSIETPELKASDVLLLKLLAELIVNYSFKQKLKLITKITPRRLVQYVKASLANPRLFRYALQLVKPPWK